VLDSRTISILGGIDDATKCPVIGSIFIAGVSADMSTIEHWKKLGVKDSKLIAFKKRNRLAEIIKETALSYSIHEVTPAMIDNKSFNLNDWEMLVVFKILNDLKNKSEVETVYIDNWDVSAKLFKQRYRKLIAYKMKKTLCSHQFRINRKKINALELIPEHRADENHIVVGAASILAKSASDAQYKKYKRKYGDFGSGNPGDSKTRLFVWNHRHNPLPIIRTSWHTFKTLLPLEKFEDDPLALQRKSKSSLKNSQ
jgi:ribonuclease HII